MTENRTIRFGLLGAGLIAPFHAKAIKAAEGCELVAVADLDGDTADAEEEDPRAPSLEGPVEGQSQPEAVAATSTRTGRDPHPGR